MSVEIDEADFEFDVVAEAEEVDLKVFSSGELWYDVFDHISSIA